MHEEAMNEKRNLCDSYESLLIEASNNAEKELNRANTANIQVSRLENELQTLPIQLRKGQIELEEMRKKLIDSEEARQMLRSVVDRTKKELEKIRTLGKKWQHAAHVLKKKERNNISLRLQYEALLRTHQELRAQVHSLAWQDDSINHIASSGNNNRNADTSRLMIPRDGSPSKIGVLVLKDVQSPH